MLFAKLIPYISAYTGRFYKNDSTTNTTQFLYSDVADMLYYLHQSAAADITVSNSATDFPIFIDEDMILGAGD